jgi:hypothetical protein
MQTPVHTLWTAARFLDRAKEPTNSNRFVSIGPRQPFQELSPARRMVRASSWPRTPERSHFRVSSSFFATKFAYASIRPCRWASGFGWAPARVVRTTSRVGPLQGLSASMAPAILVELGLKVFRQLRLGILFARVGHGSPVPPQMQACSPWKGRSG